MILFFDKGRITDKMKKIFALLLCLSLVLSLTAGLTASAEEGFDPNLAGAWVLDKAEDNDSDSELLEKLFKDLFFLPDGSFSCAALPFPYLAAMKQEAPKAETANGTIVLDALADSLSDAAYSLFSILPEENAEYAKELKTISELRVTYEFFDIPEEGYADYTPHNDLEKTLFKADSKDGLKIRVSAIVTKDGLDRQAFEASGSFHKTINEEYMMAYLTGEWTDSSENAWTFGYVQKDGEPVYQYSVWLANGDYHESDHGYGPWTHYAGDTVYGTLEPYFDGASTQYKITALIADTMTLRDEVGEIVMTRAE